jgi:hypothetical protein
VADGAKNMQATVAKFPGVASIWCTAHLLNLCVRDVLDGGEGAIATIIATCRSVVGSFKHSELLNQKLLDRQKERFSDEQRFCDLVQDVSTRWNSTYLMIDSILRNK